MNGSDLLRIVDLMHREKSIPKDVIFAGIEAAVLLAMQKHYDDAENVIVQIDRVSGQIHARYKDAEIDPELLGRISAQSAKQVMIQKIREAEGNALFDAMAAQKGDLVVAHVQRFEG